jgi:hypothetical protein
MARHFAVDQFSADIIATIDEYRKLHKVELKIHIHEIEKMVATCRKLQVANVEDPIHEALELHGPYESDLARAAREDILKVIFARRKMAEEMRDDDRRGRYRPFAPR